MKPLPEDSPALQSAAAVAPLKVVMLVFDGANLLDISGPLQALQSTSIASGIPRYETVVASFKGGLIETVANVSILTVKMDELDPDGIDTVLIAGGSRNGRPIVPPEIVCWIQGAAPHAR